MSAFLYYCPGCSTVDEAVRRYSLQWLFPAPPSQVNVANGPEDGPAGIVLAPSDLPGKANPGYHPDQQQWTRAPGSAGPNFPPYWIGQYLEHHIGPSDLAAIRVADCYRIPLADGDDWLIPRVRIYPEGTALPSAIVATPDGELTTELLPEYASLFGAVDRLWTRFCVEQGLLADTASEPLDERDGWKIAIRALGINYRVRLAEVSLLRLLTTVNVKHVLSALYDLPAWYAAQHDRETAAQKKSPA